MQMDTIFTVTDHEIRNELLQGIIGELKIHKNVFTPSPEDERVFCFVQKYINLLAEKEIVVNVNHLSNIIATNSGIVTGG